MANEVVIIDAVRTPIGNFMGTLKDWSAPQLGAHTVGALLERTKIDKNLVDEVIMGNVVTAGIGQNPARQAALKAGLPPTVGAMVVNKVCGSGLKSVVLGAQAIALGDADFIIAGGQESMSQAPYLARTLRYGQRLGHTELVDAMIYDGLWCPFENFHMGNTGEIVAKECQVTREDQDRYAAESHKRAVSATKEGKFKSEIAPIKIPQKKGDAILFEKDEGPREDAAYEKLATLKPAFDKNGTVTAGNASSINDGASAALIGERKKAEKAGFKPLAVIRGYITVGIEPRLLMLAPEGAVRKLWEKTGWKKDDVDLYELNEAFSAQSVALLKRLELDPARVNVHGGAVSLGHPIGASGARILTTLIYALKDRKAKRGIASLCLGGGNAVGMAIEML